MSENEKAQKWRKIGKACADDMETKKAILILSNSGPVGKRCF